jgi:hypothetical protein
VAALDSKSTLTQNPAKMQNNTYDTYPCDMQRGSVYSPSHAPCSAAPKTADTPTRNTTAPARTTREPRYKLALFMRWDGWQVQTEVDYDWDQLLAIVRHHRQAGLDVRNLHAVRS